MGNKIEKGKGSEACVGILKDGHGEVFVHPKITQVDQLSSIRKALHTSYPNLVNSLTNITMLTDMRHKRQKIILASRGFTELTGYHPSFFMGKNCRFLQGPGTSPDAVEALRVAIRTASPIQVAILNYKRDGTPFLNGLTMMPLRCSKSKPFRLTHYLAIQTDCTPSNSISRGLPFPKEASAATPLSLSLASSSSSSSSFTTPTAAGASSSTSSLTSSNPPASSAKTATSAKSLLSPSFLALSSSSSLVYETSAAEVPGSAKRRPSQSQDESTRGGSESDSFSSMTSADYSSIGSRSVTSQPHSSSNFGSQQSVSSTGLLSDMPRHDITVTADQRALASRLMAVQKILGTSPEPVSLPPNEVPPTVGPEEVLLSSDITSQTWDENLFPKIDTPFWSLFVCCQQRDAFSAVADQLATLNNVRLIRQDLTQVIRRIVAPQTRATSSSEAVSSDFSAEIPSLGSVDLDGQNIQLPAALVVPCTSYPTDLEHQPQIFTELLSILSSEQRKSVLSLLSSIVSHRYQGEMPVGGVALLRLSSQCALIFVSLGPWRLVAHDSPYHIFKSVLRAFCRAQTAPHMFQQVLGCHPSTATSPPLVYSLFCLPFHNSCVYPTLVPSHEPSFISTAGQMQLAYLEVASHFYPHPSSCSPVAPAQRARAIAQAIVALDQYSPSPSVRILSLLRKGELWSRGLFDTAEVQIFISIVGGKEPSQTKADQGEAAKVALQFLSSPNTLGSPELRDEIREGVLSHISEVLPIIGSEVRFYTEISHADLQFSKSVVGRGGTSTVLRAQWDGKEVAVKRFVDASPSLVVRELNVMALLKHPHVVTFYGACTLPMPHEEDRTYAVMELAGNQTIFHLLHPRNSPRKSPRSSSSSSSSSSPRMDTNEILSRYALAWLYQISLAIEYLHSHSLIHRDIKSCNVLLFEDYAVAKLTDYGLTRFQFNPDVAMTASIGTPNWMAPEILLDAKYSFPADIWSLGMIIYEVITRAIPFEACKTSAAISKEISSGHVPTLSGPFFDTLSPTNKRVLTTIYRGCTHTRPAKRLSAHETSFMLSKLVVK